MISSLQQRRLTLRLQRTALRAAAEPERYWLANGADVSASDDHGWTALHWAVRMACAGGDRLEVCRLLLDAGSDPNALDKVGKSVLANAMEASAADYIISLLRSRGAT